MKEPLMKIGVAGAGTMGTGIAQVAAASGHEVIVYDSQAAALDRARESLRRTFDKLIARNKISERDASAWSGRIQWESGLDNFGDCGLVIEAVVEDLSVKHGLFADLEGVVKESCILATNTSSLSIASVGGKCARPERIMGVHFFNPAPLMPLVELVPGLATDEGLPGRMKTLMEQWGKVPVVARDTPGFIVNRIARPYYGEALRIYEEGMAGFAEIDAAMKTYGGFRMGPFELMDLIGNDVNYQVTASVWEQLFYDPRYRPSITQKRLFESGRYGRKSGRGYFDYSESAPSPASEVSANGEEVFMRILCMLINEAADALLLGIAGKDDIELAMTRGVNYPKGLLKWADEIGVKHVFEHLLALQEEYGEDRYRPSVLLRRMASGGTRFFT